MPEIIIKKSAPEATGLYRRHRETIEALFAKYPTRRSAMLPILWLIQEEDGYISDELMEETARVLGCTKTEVMEVVSFYPMYNVEPVGKYVLGICATLPCALCAADGLFEYLSEKLGIGWEETSADGMWTIQRRECLGACDIAPVMLVNQKLEIKLTCARVDEILEECRQGQREPYFTGRRNAT